MSVETRAATPLGAAWVDAMAAGDEEALLAVLDPAVDFGALTPGGAWEASTSTEAAAIVLGRWFTAPRRIESIERVDHASVGTREQLGYRFGAATADGPAVVEQQAFFDVVDGRIAWMRILCSGFRPMTGASDGQ